MSDNKKQRLSLTLYGRPECGLCDEMLAALQADYGDRVRVEKHDISGDPALERRFELKIPVLMLDGEMLCYGHLDTARLDQALAAQSSPHLP